MTLRKSSTTEVHSVKYDFYLVYIVSSCQLAETVAIAGTGFLLKQADQSKSPDYT